MRECEIWNIIICLFKYNCLNYSPYITILHNNNEHSWEVDYVRKHKYEDEITAVKTQVLNILNNYFIYIFFESV